MKVKWINIVTLLYVVITLIVTLSSRIIPWKLLLGERVDAVLYILLAGFGALLLILDFFTEKVWKQGKYIFVLYGFVVVMGVSSILNIQYGYVDNIKTIVWTVIQFGIFYTLYCRTNRQTLMKYIDVFWGIISAGWMIASIYSIGQYCSMKKYTVTVESGRKLRQGFVENRLFGIFNDPNYAAVTSLCVVIAMIYLAVKYRKKWLQIWAALNVIVQIFYIVLSGSRTTLVCAIVVTCCWGWSWLFTYSKNTKLLLAKMIGIAMISIVLVLGIDVGCQKFAEFGPKVYRAVVSVDKTNTTNNTKKVNKSKSNVNNLQRKDVSVDNFSNNRTTIWISYLKGMEGDVLFGGSPRNALTKWIEKDPNGYLAVTNYETHNGYLYVLVGTGIIGVIVLLIYMILYLKRMYNFIKQEKRIDQELVFIGLIMITLLVYTCFFTELFFIHNFTAVVFWSHCGASILLSEKSKQENE